MKHMKEIYFWDDLYKRNYHVFIGGELEDVEKRCLKKYNITLPEGKQGDGKIYEIINYGFIIWFRKYANNPWCNSVLTHEMAHATLYLFDQLGMKLDGDNSEQFTYYIGWLVEKFHEGYKKLK